MRLDKGQSCSRLVCPGAVSNPGLRKLELVTKVAWKSELGGSGRLITGRPEGTWEIGDAR